MEQLNQKSFDFIFIYELEMKTSFFFLLPLFDSFLVLVKTGPVAALICRNASLANVFLKINTSNKGKFNSIWNARPRFNTEFSPWVNKLQLQLQIQMRCKSSLRKSRHFARYHWFPHDMTSEKRAQKFHTDDVSLPRSGKCV